MLAILIVEDNTGTLELLRDYLANEFPYARIDTAEYVEEAIQEINDAHDAGIAYKIAILDFILPRSKADPAKVIDTTLRSALRASMSRDAVVFHITAHPDSPEIEDFLRREERRSPDGARPVVISKLDDEVLWTDTLYDSIRRVVHGDRISAGLDRLGGGVSPDRPDAPAIDTLLDDAEAHWKYLPAALQARIDRLFRVRHGSGGVTIDLL